MREQDLAHEEQDLAHEEQNLAYCVAGLLDLPNVRMEGPSAPSRRKAVELVARLSWMGALNPQWTYAAWIEQLDERNRS